MPRLRELQTELRGALIGGESTGAENYIVSDGLSAGERLNIYRNTFLSTLTTALRISYPAVQGLVGEEFFEGAARQFIEQHPPQSAYLNLYGGGFGDFLQRFEPAASLAYLADVARLEWAVNGAFHAKDVPPLDIADLSKLSATFQTRLCFIPHPSVAFLRSDYPVDAIWRAVLSKDDAALEKIDLSADPAWLMIARLADQVEVTRFGKSEWRLTAALCEGQSLASALPIAEDAPDLLARHLANGLFVDFRILGERE